MQLKLVTVTIIALLIIITNVTATKSFGDETATRAAKTINWLDNTAEKFDDLFDGLEKEVREGLGGLAELKTINITGIDAVADEIPKAAKAENITQLKGLLSESEVGARPEYANEIKQARKQIITSFGKKTDVDFVLKNDKFLNIKNDSFLANASKESITYQQFADELDTMLTYQTENQINSGVEIVSKTKLSNDIVSYLQKLIDNGNNISWRIIE